MTDLNDVDYTLESFMVPDLHPRSQERHPKSGRVPDFKKIIIEFLEVSLCFGGFSNFFFQDNFWKSDWLNFRNFGEKNRFIFNFLMLLGALGVWKLF